MAKNGVINWRVNIYSSVAVYVQLENQVMFLIANGIVKEGDQLPSVREMSENLGVNPNTVAKSYRDLEVMGHLYTRRGMGVFIKKGAVSNVQKTVKTRTMARVLEVAREAGAAGLDKKELANLFSNEFIEGAAGKPVYV